MAETVGDLIRSELLDKKGVFIYANLPEEIEFVTEPPGYLVEKLDFFVAPRKLRGFSESGLLDFQDSLPKMPALTFPVSPHWEGHWLNFGSIGFLEFLKSYSDLINPALYLQYLDNTEGTPNLDPKTSFRETTIHIYPSPSYALQIGNYHSNLLAGICEPDPKMEFLTHGITRRQLRAYSRSSRLTDLPSET